MRIVRLSISITRLRGSFLFSLSLLDIEISAHVLNTIIFQSLIQAGKVVEFDETKTLWTIGITVFQNIARLSGTECVEKFEDIIFCCIVRDSWNANFENGVTFRGLLSFLGLFVLRLSIRLIRGIFLVRYFFLCFEICFDFGFGNFYFFLGVRDVWDGFFCELCLNFLLVRCFFCFLHL